MNEEQQKIYDYLLTNALGYSNRKTSTQIRENCNLESGGPTNEHVRDLVREMILNHDCCIGSVLYVDGYWIIQSEEELEKATTSLEKRAEGVVRRSNALKTNWKKKQNG
jgi:hypothetical protein